MLYCRLRYGYPDGDLFWSRLLKVKTRKTPEGILISYQRIPQRCILNSLKNEKYLTVMCECFNILGKNFVVALFRTCGHGKCVICTFRSYLWRYAVDMRIVEANTYACIVTSKMSNSNLKLVISYNKSCHWLIAKSPFCIYQSS